MSTYFLVEKSAYLALVIPRDSLFLLLTASYRLPGIPVQYTSHWIPTVSTLRDNLEKGVPGATTWFWRVCKIAAGDAFNPLHRIRRIKSNASGPRLPSSRSLPPWAKASATSVFILGACRDAVRTERRMWRCKTFSHPRVQSTEWMPSRASRTLSTDLRSEDVKCTKSATLWSDEIGIIGY